MGLFFVGGGEVGNVVSRRCNCCVYGLAGRHYCGSRLRSRELESPRCSGLCALRRLALW